MSGLPPPGMRHFPTTLRVANESREMDPSPRFVTYRTLASRRGYRPCAPLPVGMKPILRKLSPSMTQTPLLFMSATYQTAPSEAIFMSCGIAFGASGSVPTSCCLTTSTLINRPANSQVAMK